MKKIRIAEWVSLIISAVLVLAVGGYLFYRWFQPEGEYVGMKIEVMKDKIAERNDRWLVPVEITNNDARAIQKLTLKLKNEDYELDYLPPKGKQKFYVFLQSKEEVESLKIELVAYTAE